MEPFIAQIMMFGGNFAPRGWAFCDGQLLPIANYTALFSLIGTTYGGDGRTAFALPDLRGRASLHPGNGPGLSPVKAGERGGAETHTLNVLEMPSHSHDGSTLNGTLGVNEEDGASDDPQGRNFGIAQNDSLPYNSNTNDKVMASGAVGISGNTSNTGGNQPFNIRNPYLGVNYIIALQGIFPSRS